MVGFLRARGGGDFIGDDDLLVVWGEGVDDVFEGPVEFEVVEDLYTFFVCLDTRGLLG